ncbi:sensor histidine kinase [Methylorubrum salsuginis]|uniref:histidine kinase n=1 Tax=Methylorubrum salsuginis TaxID=414703 RepID=A0A1I4FGL1_9HYPH|nr:HAMP domain-containing sensor histidine kinase [Methylorubrum salsuginis]SFL17105.1 Signal transduction histidine kinase [Methylorubrum salsuginis]
MTAPAEPAREGPLARLQKVFRTTAFKLSLAYLVLFALLASGGLGYVAWNARRVLDDQIVSTIEAEINGLSEQYTAGGLRRLIAVVERRAKEPGASLYLVTTPAGEHIVGNVSRVPVGVLSSPGQYEGPYGRGSESDQAEHRAIMRVYTLAGGFRLLVGRDTEERDRLRDAIGNTFGSSLALVLVLGVVGGWFVASRVLKRVDDMTETTRSIMAGDLDGRLKVSGSGDELDRLALNLNLMLERIGELMRGMREVSDNIAHDLKTPLTRLRNRADEALRTAQTPDDLRAAIEGIVEDGDGLIRVFNALLTIARLEAGSAPDTTGIDFDAGEVAGEMAELYEALAEERGLHLGFTREPNLPLRGNRELVGQALANLIDNAIKYGAGGAPAITVAARRDGDSVILQVADHGPGVPEAERARVLDRFVRLDAARTRPGFGLGLSLVNAVARLHGGSLSLGDNAPGLIVTLTLPAAKN